MQLAFPAPQPTIVAVAGKPDLGIPVRRVYCVGRNYAAHAREMGRDPDREAPFFFMKPADAVVPDRSRIAYPMATRNFHHEIELVVAIGKAGREIPLENALEYAYAYGVGIDLTRRDLQLDARDKGRPWDSGKGFDRSAPLAPLHLASEIGHPEKGRIWIEVNGETRQSSDIALLIWSVPEIISTLSREFELAPGDLIFTGTPEGVGPLKPGDRAVGGIDGLGTIEITID